MTHLITTDPAREPTQSANGRPHLAYYAEGISFVWSGNLLAPIEVCPGGYGEPVTDRIVITNDTARRLRSARSPESLVALFGDVCDAYLERFAD